MANRDYISLRRLDHFWENAKKYIANAVNPTSGEKEILTVIGVGSSKPGQANEGDYFIQDNVLVRWENGDWTVAEASTDVLYLAADTSHLYVWNGEQFNDVTGEAVDNTIYVNNITTALGDYTERGLYTVCHSTNGGATNVYYTFVVSKVRRRSGRNFITTFTQTLSNHSGYLVRSKTDEDAWSEWTEHIYQEQIGTIENEDINDLFEE